MEILFIETPSPWLIRQHTQIPIGLLLLATIVKNANYEVKFIRPHKMKELTKYKNYDIFCFSATTLEYPVVCDCAKLIRKKSPKAKIFLGGTHASAMYNEIKETKLFDAICVREGENVILKMIEDVKKNKLKQVYFMEEFVKDLDSLPFIDYDLVEGSLGGKIFFGRKSYKKGNTINFITSRGCPFNCAFCASQAMWKRKVRFRSIKNIIKEMKFLIEKYDITEFRLADDNLVSNPKRCLKFCKAIKPLNIIWRCSIRAESITPKIAKAMYESGCREISPGIESGDQRVLDYLNKRTSLQKMKIGCKNAQDERLKVRALFMIGTPGEQVDTPEKNRDYIHLLKPDALTLSTFLPLPGTPIFHNPKQFNCEILSYDWTKYNKDYYISKNGKASKRKYTPLIRNKFLSLDNQISNVKRMEKYIEEFGKYNKG
jgi:radical SAM superfamily enzyme YgiQ (UPF0313 family)